MELLEKLLNNENVSRWDVFRNRKEIIAIMQNNPNKYESIYDEVIDIIESAKESL